MSSAPLGIFLNTVVLKPLADSIWLITSKLEFAAGLVIVFSLLFG